MAVGVIGPATNCADEFGSSGLDTADNEILTLVLTVYGFPLASGSATARAISFSVTVDDWRVAANTMSATIKRMAAAMASNAAPLLMRPPGASAFGLAPIAPTLRQTISAAREDCQPQDAARTVLAPVAPRMVVSASRGARLP